MIKLIDILKEIEQEQQVEEGRLGNILTGAAMTAATMLGGAKGQTKAPVDKDKTPIEMSKFSEKSASTVLGQSILKQWDDLHNWLEKTTVNDIDGSGDTSKLMGNPKLDNGKFNAKMVAKFKQKYPDYDVTDNNTVKKIQASIVDHRNGTIEADKIGKIELAKGKYRGTDYKDYLSHVSKIQQKAEKEGDFDGIIGQYTSKVLIPKDLRGKSATATYASTPIVKK